MKSFLLTTMLLAPLTGCTIHEPAYQIIYTPDKHLTNSQVTWVPADKKLAAVNVPSLGAR